jgi:hypothetical protein
VDDHYDIATAFRWTAGQHRLLVNNFVGKNPCSVIQVPCATINICDWWEADPGQGDRVVKNKTVVAIHKNKPSVRSSTT